MKGVVRRERAAVRGALPLLLLGMPRVAGAHGFGQRFDLPVPIELYLVGAGTTVLLSFVVAALFLRPGERDPSRLARELPPGLNRALSHPIWLGGLRFASVVVWATAISAGLWGSQDPSSNILPTLIWILWWIGLVYVCVLVGDVWALLNPWSICFEWAERLHARLRPGRRFGVAAPYPSSLGTWPAVLAFVGFVWAELVWPTNAVPWNLACLALGYTVYLWTGMFVFGRSVWLEAADAFTVAFGLFARFAPFEASPTLRVRPLGAALLPPEPISVSHTAFVLVMLATVTFDGFLSTSLWQSIHAAIEGWKPLQPLLFALYMGGFGTDLSIPTIGLAAAILVFVGTYSLFAILISIFGGRGSADKSRPVSASSGSPSGRMWVARSFVLTLVPIAIAYHLAHYLAFLLTAGQLIIPLASDPFGWGWNLFGTIGYQVDIAIVGARFVWFTCVIAIVLGHVFAVYLSHVLALRLFPSGRAALSSQVPMLFLMIGYTLASLWILAQPIIE